MKDIMYIGLLSENINSFGNHQNPYWEIVYYTHGTGTLNVGGKDFEFHPGYIVCIPPNFPHYEYSLEGFRNAYLFVKTFNTAMTVQNFKDNHSRDFFTVFHLLHKEFHIKRKNWSIITEGLLSILEQYIISYNIEKRKNPFIEIFENQLISNLSNIHFRIDKSINAACSENGYSSEYFRRLFQKETGLTPSEYLLQKRIDYAKQLLNGRHSHIVTIKQIALMVGFEDPYYFSRVFKKVIGKSPIE